MGAFSEYIGNKIDRDYNESQKAVEASGLTESGYWAMARASVHQAAKKEKRDVPPKVKELAERIKEKSKYDVGRAYATAWSIYCRDIDPGSEHCKKSGPTEYFTHRNSRRQVMTLRKRTIRLAHENKALRPYLLPLLREAKKKGPFPWDDDFVKKDDKGKDDKEDDKKKEDKKASLRTRTLRLAKANPELRPFLIRAIKQADENRKDPRVKLNRMAMAHVKVANTPKEAGKLAYEAVRKAGGSHKAGVFTAKRASSLFLQSPKHLHNLSQMASVLQKRIHTARQSVKSPAQKRELVAMGKKLKALNAKITDLRG